MSISTTEERPWGRFEVLLDAKDCKVKRITVDAGKRFSLQRHQKRDEHWIIISGVGVVTCGRGDPQHIDYNDQYIVKPGYRTKISADHIHRLEAMDDEPVVFIEVQVGEYFGEDDIERFEDDFGRVSNE